MTNNENRKIVKYFSIVGIVSILLLLSLISIGYFINFNGDRIYSEETLIPDGDSGLMVLMPDSSSTGMMPDTEEEEPDADGDVIAESAHSSGGRRGSGGGFFHATNSEPSPPDLRIKDPDEEDIWQDGVTATWTMSNMMPGDSVSSWVKFINKGETPASNLTINCMSVTIDHPGPECDTEEGTTDLDKEMIITEMIYYYQSTEQIDCLSLLPDLNENGNKDLDDLEAQTIDLPAPGMTDASATTLTMTIQFSQEAGNEYQGDILNTTFKFTLIQYS
ncbi:MAG: TasA family protein [Halobacteriota archaeon]